MTQTASVTRRGPIPPTRPTYKTDSGRLVRGGGGIVPDLIVRQDSLSEGERAFATSLAAKFAEYRDALTATALQIKN